MRKFTALIGSYGLAAVLLLFLLVLTLAGTLEQQRSTLYDVQTNYFESLGVVHYWAGKYPTPLPGGLLLMGLLAVNLLVGGLVRVRKGVTTLGVFIGHLGIMFILVGSGMEALFSTKGVTRIWEPLAAEDSLDEAGRFMSYRDWELAIIRHEADGSTTEFVIPHGEIDGLEGDTSLRAQHPDLPFDLVLYDYMRNSRVRRPTAQEGAEAAIGGLVLESKPPVGAAEERKGGNVAGIKARAVERASGKTHEGLVWGMQGGLFRFDTGGQLWSFDLRKRTWPLPFDIRLTRFVHEYHPGTSMPRRYSSYVEVSEDSDDGEVKRDVHITMNEPLRHGMYTLYQSGWGPQMGDADRRLFSDLAVVKMPSSNFDLVPWIGCGIVFAGLLIHFFMKLYRFLSADARRRAYARTKADAGRTA